MSNLAKRTKLDVNYNGSNITVQLYEFLMNWSFTDNLSGAIDDLSLTLEDRDALWLQSWFPVQGSTIAPTIVREGWAKYPLSTKLGLFEVDEIFGKNSVISIKALATSEKSSLRKEEKCNAWEKSSLKKVLGAIASKNGMSLVWQSKEDPKKDRYEQDNQTDLAFMYEECREAGLCLKINSNKIIVLDEKDYEEKQPVTHINRMPREDDKIKIIDRSFTSSITDVFKECRVQHHEASKKKTIKGSFTAPGVKTGRTLVVKQQVKSQAEAKQLAKKKLREKNKEAVKFTLKVYSQMHIDAGMTFDLREFGHLSGKYIATQVVYGPHEITLQLRKCLEGY